MDWDGDVLYQSTRLSAYESILERLQHLKICFHCDCSRQRVSGWKASTTAAVAAGTNLRPGVSHQAKIRPETVRFTDGIQGDYAQNLEHEVGDFILRRKDGLFAYQLAVVADDAEQEITHIVRGYDLLSSTRDRFICSNYSACQHPATAHSNHCQCTRTKTQQAAFCRADRPQKRLSLLISALQFLGMTPPPSLIGAAPVSLVTWGAEHWDIQRVPKLAKMTR